MHRLIVNQFQAMRRPTGFTMDNSYVAFGCRYVVSRCRGGGGGVCVAGVLLLGRDVLCKSRCI